MTPWEKLLLKEKVFRRKSLSTIIYERENVDVLGSGRSRPSFYQNYGTTDDGEFPYAKIFSSIPDRSRGVFKLDVTCQVH